MLFDEMLMPLPTSSPAGNSCWVTNQNAIAESTAETITPLYRAFMILPPALVLTKKVPMIEAMIETPPSTIG